METLIVESTLGGKEDILQSKDELNQRLLELINSCLTQGGNLLFPISIVGQSQDADIDVKQFCEDRFAFCKDLYREIGK